MHHRAGAIGRREFLRRGAAVTAAAFCAADPAAQPLSRHRRSRSSESSENRASASRLSTRPRNCLAEGFVDVEYLQTQSEPHKATGSGSSMGSDDGRDDLVAAGLADIHTGMVGRLVVSIDAGDPIRILAGIHAGCLALRHRSSSLNQRSKGRTVAVPGLGSSHYLYIASIAAYVGIDAHNDITFVTPLGGRRSAAARRRNIDAAQLRPFRRSSARARSVTWSSIAVWTGHGRSTSAAC